MEAQPVDEKGDVRSDSSRAQKGQEGEQCREERKRDSEPSDDDSDTELLKSMAKMVCCRLTYGGLFHGIKKSLC